MRYYDIGGASHPSKFKAYLETSRIKSQRARDAYCRRIAERVMLHLEDEIREIRRDPMFHSGCDRLNGKRALVIRHAINQIQFITGTTTCDNGLYAVVIASVCRTIYPNNS